MKKVLVTGSGGFVGLNFQGRFNVEYIISLLGRNDDLNINDDYLLHLAGKAHDLKNFSSVSEYYEVNTDLASKVFDAFLASEAKVFISLSSVKAVADEVQYALTEEHVPNPITHFGKSKLLAEQYILSKEIPEGKRVYILRPCMIHGPGNKGNLNLLYKLAAKGLPWPLGGFENKRSFCSIDNLLFVFKELIEREDIPSGVYNIADDEPLSTNELIELIAHSQEKRPKIWKISSKLISKLAKVGDFLRLPLNTERLQKLTESYVVSNAKIVMAIGKPLPVSSREGLIKTFKSFNN